MANNAIKATSYSALAARILEETLVLPALGLREFQNPTDSFKVWVAGDESMVNYSPGTPLSGTDPEGDYVTINDPKDKAIYKIIDKNQLRKVYNPVEHIDQLVVKAIQAASVQLDSDVLASIVDDGTEAFAAGIDKPTTGAEVKEHLLSLEQELNEAKAPLDGRFLIVTPGMAKLIEQAAVLQTAFGDSIQTNGFKTIGAFAGFTILMSLYLPSGTNMVALHRDAFGGNFEQIEPIELIEVPRGQGTIGAWAVDGRMALQVVSA
jgi:hypothetical protein